MYIIWFKTIEDLNILLDRMWKVWHVWHYWDDLVSAHDIWIDKFELYNNNWWLYIVIKWNYVSYWKLWSDRIKEKQINFKDFIKFYTMT